MLHLKTLGILSLVTMLLSAGSATGFEPAPGSGPYMAVLRAVTPVLRRDIAPDVGVNVEQMKVEGDWAYAQLVPIDLGGPIDWSKTRFAADHAAGKMSPWAFALLHKDAAGEWRVLECRIGAKAADWPTWIARHHPPDALVSAGGNASAPATTPPAVPSSNTPPTAESSPPLVAAPSPSPAASSEVDDPGREPDAALGGKAIPSPPEKTGSDVATSPEARAAKLTADGAAAYSAHDDATALTRFDEALALQPTLVRALVGRARVHARADDLFRAVADLDHAIEIEPRNAVAINLRGLVWGRLKEPGRAVADYDKAIALAPRLWSARFNRGRLHAAAERWDAALADFDAAVAIDPKVEALFVHRGNVQFERKHYEEAIADHGRAFAIAPHPSHLVNRAMAELALGRLAEAVYDTTRAIAMDPKMSQAYYLRAQARFRSKDFAAAIIDLDAAIELKSDAHFHAWRSATNRALGRLQDADRDLAEARRLDPKVSVPTAP